MTKNINLGRITVPVEDYASQGNAILGIRGSGKSYSGTCIAEQLLDQHVPITVLDPIGVWRFLRVPATEGGRAYPVVVAGGQHADIPLPVHGAAEIMRAAMRDGVSIVFDLYDVNLSKTDWRAIVTAVVKVLLYENKAHGLRHVFIEEAAEFVPQNIGKDHGAVYGMCERLIRMGGNVQLGCTLINQRAEEVNKAVLELCDLLLLHRQKGRRSLTNLAHWLDLAAGPTAKDVADAVPSLKNGECYVWPEGAAAPTRTMIPAKHTFHPDRRAMKQAVIAEGRRVDASAFVAAMQAALPAIVKEAEENDPRKLKAEIARLKRAVPAAGANESELDEAETRGFVRGRARGREEIREDAFMVVKSAIQDAERQVKHFNHLLAVLEEKYPRGQDPAPRPPVEVRQAPPRREHVPPATPRREGSVALDKPQRAFLTALAQQGALARHELAVFAGYSAGSRHVDNTLAALRSAGHVTGDRSRVDITETGRQALGDYDPLPTGKALQDYWLQKLDTPGERFLRVILAAYPGTITRAEAAVKANYSPDSRHVDNTLATLRVRRLITGPRAAIKASDDLFS